MVDLLERLDAVVATVTGARAMPLSASCLLNRVELLAALDDLRMLVPEVLADADRVLAERDMIIDEAHRVAAAIVAEARRECSRLASGSALAEQAGRQAEAIVESARTASDTMRTEIDQYVDGKLAEFEALLGRTLTSVTRGRARLAEGGGDRAARSRPAWAGPPEPANADGWGAASADPVGHVRLTGGALEPAEDAGPAPVDEAAVFGAAVDVGAAAAIG
jgi:vacuolar-type H+-ATPase subunit H